MGLWLVRVWAGLTGKATPLESELERERKCVCAALHKEQDIRIKTQESLDQEREAHATTESDLVETKTDLRDTEQRRDHFLEEACKAETERDAWKDTTQRVQVKAQKMLKRRHGDKALVIPKDKVGEVVFVPSDFELPLPPDGDPASPNSILAILDRALKEHPDLIHASGAARRSAGDCYYRDPTVFQQMIDCFVKDYVEAKTNSVSKSLKDHLKDKGYTFDYVRSLSDSTVSLDKRYLLTDKEFLPPGTKNVKASEHFKKGNAQGVDKCFRVYWWWDHKNKRVILNHIGSHLKSPRTT